MSEFLLELYSEEIPPSLQTNARKELHHKIEESCNEKNLKFGSISSYSTPTRIVILIQNLSEKIKVPSKLFKASFNIFLDNMSK